MNTTQTLRLLRSLAPLVSLGALFHGAGILCAGTIEGRIFNADIDKYVYQARIRISSSQETKASSTEVFSSEDGSFRIDNVPAGDASLEVFYTGFAKQVLKLQVPSEGSVQADVTLKRSDELVTLDVFVVSSARETNATALAVNSQRFAGNTRSVVATDELGFIGDGSVAGALKFLPGVDLEPDSSGFSNSITLSGAPSANLPVTYGGFDVMTSADLIQNASGNANQRSANLMQLSLTNISRIEINRSPTPDTPGSSLAGSVNFVPKSAFERAKPSYALQVFGTANEDKLKFRNSSGPQSERAHQIYPGMNFSAIVPVSKSFGFSLTLSHNETPKGFDRTLREKTANWDLANNTWKSTPNNPSHYMLYWQEMNSILSTYTRDSINLTADLKLSKADTLSASFTQSYNELLGGQRQVRWTMDRMATSLDIINSTPTMSQTVAVPPNNATILNNTYYTDFVDTNRQFQLKYTHKGRNWSAELGASYGNAGRASHDLDRGFIFSSLYNLTRTNIQFSDIQAWTVGKITASRNGVAVNPMDLNTFVPAGNFTSNVSGTSPTVAITSSLPPFRFKPYTTDDKKGQINGFVTRDFNYRIPTSVKLGFDVSDYKRSQSYDKYIGTGSGFAYNGTDVPLTQFLNNGYDAALPGGIGVPSSMDNRKLAQFYKDNASKFVQLNPGGDYQTATSNSKYLHETISAGYLRVDNRLFNNRLWLVWGARFEQTTDQGKGPRNDVTGNYKRNAAGQFVDAAGNPVAVGKTPALIYTSGSLDAIKATWFPRGTSAKRTYGNLLPSFNANYNLSDDLIARVSYSNTIGRPDIYNVAPGLTLPDPTSLAPKITVNNTGIKPWTSENISGSLEYYSKSLGDITLRGYRRFISNGFASQLLPAAQAQEVLNLYNVNLADYPGNTNVQTLQTVPGQIVTSGLELSSRYNLDEFLPRWARGFQIKLSAARSTLTGGGTAATAFAAQNLYLVPYSVGMGVTFARPRYSISLNGKWNARQRLAYIDPATDSNGAIEPGTYEYIDSALRVDLDATFNLTKTLSLFINGRDINTYKRTLLRYGPNTPELLKGRQLDIYQPVWTLGMNAKF